MVLEYKNKRLIYDLPKQELIKNYLKTCNLFLDESSRQNFVDRIRVVDLNKNRDISSEIYQEICNLKSFDKLYPTGEEGLIFIQKREMDLWIHCNKHNRYGASMEGNVWIKYPSSKYLYDKLLTIHNDNLLNIILTFLRTLCLVYTIEDDTVNIFNNLIEYYINEYNDIANKKLYNDICNEERQVTFTEKSLCDMLEKKEITDEEYYTYKEKYQIDERKKKIMSDVIYVSLNAWNKYSINNFLLLPINFDDNKISLIDKEYYSNLNEIDKKDLSLKYVISK